MLRLIGFIVVVVWLLGLIAKIGGGFINLLLIIALVLFIASFFGGRANTNDV